MVGTMVILPQAPSNVEGSGAQRSRRIVYLTQSRGGAKNIILIRNQGRQENPVAVLSERRPVWVSNPKSKIENPKSEHPSPRMARMTRIGTPDLSAHFAS